MGQRLDLHAILAEIVGDPLRVYFQAPTTMQMIYPCILYKRDYAKTEFANNLPYKHMKRYQITVMDLDPDSVIPAAVAALPMCIFDRFYTANNLNHDVYKIFF